MKCLQDKKVTNNSDNNGSNSQGFNYDVLVEESLKNVVKKVLKITSETGLVGESHFFITFNGNDPNVAIEIHALLVNKNACLNSKCSVALPLFVKKSINPTNNVDIDDPTNAGQFSPP